MTDQRIAVTVDVDGTVQGRRIATNERSTKAPVGYHGLDAEVIALFEHWLTLRDEVWEEKEIRVFGSLLHRCLFSESLWFWIESAIEERGDERVRLELVFPADPPYSRLSAIPWEFLHRPDRSVERGMAAQLTRGSSCLATSARPGLRATSSRRTSYAS